MLDEASAYSEAMGQLKPGQVVVTSADNTNANAVYHVVLPHYAAPGSMRVSFCYVQLRFYTKQAVINWQEIYHCQNECLFG